MHDVWWAPPMALDSAAWYLTPWIAQASELPLEEPTFGELLGTDAFWGLFGHVLENRMSLLVNFLIAKV